MMRPLGNYLLPANGTTTSSTNDRGVVNTANVSVGAHKSSDIALVTREGDVVTLFSEQDLCATYSAFEARCASEQGSSSLIVRNQVVQQGGAFSFTVEGELNKEELRDIKKALKAIDNILESVLSGNMNKAAGKIEKLSRLDTLAAVEADIHLERSVVVERQTLAAVSAPTNATEKDGIESADDDPIENIASTSAERADETEEHEIDRAASAITDVVRGAGIEPIVMAKPINDLFTDRLKQVSHQEPTANKPRAAINRLRNAFFESLHHLLKDSAKSNHGKSLFTVHAGLIDNAA